jgi:hypothetical protein
VLERAGNTLEQIGANNEFPNRTQMPQQLRERIDKWNYMKLRSFFRTKEMVTRLKRQPTEWEKLFANYTSDKGLITRMYRELKDLSDMQRRTIAPTCFKLIYKIQREVMVSNSFYEARITLMSIR